MLCCSLIAILLGQCGALAGVARLRLSGGAGMLATIVAGWSTMRWVVLGGVLAAQLAAGALALPRLYALDTARLGAWPICAAVAHALKASAP